MKVGPFHARRFPAPKKYAAVYHVCSRCPEGSNIAKTDKIPGTGGASLCERCRMLQARGDC